MREQTIMWRDDFFEARQDAISRKPDSTLCIVRLEDNTAEVGQFLLDLDEELYFNTQDGRFVYFSEIEEWAFLE